MTTSLEDAVLHDAVRAVGLTAQDARYLHHHATTVYLLPTEQVIARINRGNEADKAAERAVAITRWLCTHGFPATAPTDVEQPVHLGEHVVTFWRYYPQDQRTQPEPFHLGALLRKLHRLPPPPVALPIYQPLATFTDTVEASTSLPGDDRAWLLAESRALLDAYNQLDFPLGTGHIHGDAYPGNLLWNEHQALLADWDETAIGPRELDLANTYQGVRFGRTADQLRAFTEAYDYDVTAWAGFPTLRKMRDLHTLGSYIRLADSKNEHAAKQLRHRIKTLRQGDTSALWIAR
jgi:aminoglycoside phosphotransferase (APT) family kinase protein